MNLLDGEVFEFSNSLVLVRIPLKRQLYANVQHQLLSIHALN
jgi:hypothetical protein